MKKIFGLILTVCLVAMLVVTPIGVSAADVDIDMGEGNEYVLGDVYEDGKINLNDLVVLAQLAAGWNVEADADAADVNVDYDVNLTDVQILAKYLAGWDVTLG